MTGAGSATAAYAMEPSGDYLGDPVDPTYIQPGKNIEVTELSLQNQLQRIRDPDNPEPFESLVGNLEGALGVTFTLTGDDWHELVFNDGGTGFTDGRMPSSRWYLGVDYLDGTTERVAKGAVVTDATVQYQQGQPTTVSLTLLYGDEAANASITPTDIQTAPEDSVHNFSGADLDVDGTSQTKLQSAQLSLSVNARFHRGPQRKPLDATIGSVNSALSTDAIYSGPDQKEIAYGGAEPASSLDAVDATLSFENALAETISYSLGDLKPDTYGWNDLVNPEADITEAVEYHVSSVGVA